MSHDAHRSSSRCWNSLVGLALIVLIIGTVAIWAAAPSLREATPTVPVLTLTAPAPELWPVLAAEYQLALPMGSREVTLSIRRGSKEWQDFETEYGLRQLHSSALLAGLQLTKYKIDELSFGVDQLLRKLEAALELEFSGGGWHHGASRPAVKGGVRARRPFEKTKLKFDVTYRDGPYLGLRLIVPLGP